MIIIIMTKKTESFEFNFVYRRSETIKMRRAVKLNNLIITGFIYFKNIRFYALRINKIFIIQNF